MSPCGSVVSAWQGQVQGYLTFLVVQHINCSEHNDLLPGKEKTKPFQDTECQLTGSSWIPMVVSEVGFFYVASLVLVKR